MQWSVAVVVDDVRVRSGPQDHCQRVLLWTPLTFVLVASFVYNNCPGDNFLYYFSLLFYNSSCSFVDTLQLPETAVWTEVLPSPSGTSVAAPWDCLSFLYYQLYYIIIILLIILFPSPSGTSVAAPWDCL